MPTVFSRLIICFFTSLIINRLAIKMAKRFFAHVTILYSNFVNKNEKELLLIKEMIQT